MRREIEGGSPPTQCETVTCSDGRTDKRHERQAMERVAPALLSLALGLGIAGAVLLRPLPWGAGAAMWAILAAVALYFAARAVANGLARGRGWLALATPALLAGGLAWRDAEALKLLDAAAAIVAFAWVLAAGAGAGSGAVGRRFARVGVSDATRRVLVGVGRAMFGAPPVIAAGARGVRLGGPSAPGGWRRRAGAMARGAALAIGPVVVFGALLRAADAVFARWIEIVLPSRWGLDAGGAFSYLLVAVVVGWLAAGALGAVATADQISPATVSVPAKLRLGPVEIGIVLGAVDALFALFVLAQIRSRFGGAAWVEATTGLTYAEYARRGFFELVAVAAIALPLLLFLDWLIGATSDRESAGPRRLFRLLAGVQIVLLGVMLASALDRMRLYQAEYGLTELRLYTSAFMGWLALIFGWFVLTVLRDRRPRFVSGAVAAGLAILIGLHVLNPDALIVRTNAALAEAPGKRPFDATYALGLGADAAPALLAAWPDLTPADRCLIGDRLLERWGEGTTDWRTWSWGRGEARSAVAERRSELVCDPDESRTIEPSAS